MVRWLARVAWLAWVIDRTRPCPSTAVEPFVRCQRHRGHRGRHRFEMRWVDWEDEP